MEKRNKKPLGMFSLVMINIIAVDSIRALPISAEYGWSLIFYYILGALLFMIPSALVSAEMATGWPHKGGAYIWVREALGKKWAYWTASLLWIYNIVWYPTILSLLASTILYIFSPNYAKNKDIVFICIFVLYWLAMYVNTFGMKASAIVSNIGSILGTLFPIGLIISLGIFWVFSGNSIAIPFSWSKIIPNLDSLNQLAVLTGMLFGMVGLEMSAVHANDVENPQKDYPKALLISVILIVVTSILGSLAIAIVIPQTAINLSMAIIQSFDIFLSAYHLSFLVPVIAICIVLSGFSGVSAWIIGPSKCMLIAGEDGILPSIFAKTNRDGVPVNLMLLQGIIFTTLALLFLLFPGFNSSYWLLTAMTAEISVLFYIVIFITIIILRFKYPCKYRAFKVPGENFGIILVSGIGLLTCLFVFIVGLFPPAQILISNKFLYELVLIGGLVILCILPLIIAKIFPRAC